MEQMLSRSGGTPRGKSDIAAAPNHPEFYTRATARRAALAFVFLTCLNLLLCSGRMASGDARSELQVSVLIATRGQIGLVHKPADDSYWDRGINGRYYQVHDIGNALLMLPAAIVGTRGSTAPNPDGQAPPMAREAAAVGYSVISAAGSVALFLLFTGFMPPRPAFVLTLVFAVGTIVWPYSKTSFDVVGACVGMCFVMLLAARVLVAESPSFSLLAAFGAACGAVCWIRFSLLAVVGLSIFSVLLVCHKRLGVRRAIVVMAVFAIALAPELLYNYIRSGNPLRPAYTAAKYYAGSSLTGSIPDGLWGLMLSPNRGLVFFSPVFIVLLLLPWVWKQMPRAMRILVCCTGLGCIVYIVAISKVRLWYTFGWGPRYLVPVLPVLYVPTAFILRWLWENKALRWPVLALVLLSAAVNVPAMFVNWQVASHAFPHALEPKAGYPAQIISTVEAFCMGAESKPLPNPLGHDEESAEAARFPDLALVRIARTSKIGAVASAVAALLLAAGVLTSGRLLLRSENGD